MDNFGFSETDIEYLRSIGYQDDFLDYLKNLKFTGHIHSMQEGEICFGNEPLMSRSPINSSSIVGNSIIKHY